MSLITVSGEAGCRHHEVARLAAQRLRFEIITESRLEGLIAEEFGTASAIPDKAYSNAAGSIIARLATEHHLILALDGGEFLLRDFPNVLRAHVTAPESHRIGALMIDRGLDRAAARDLLRAIEAERRALRKRRFRRVTLAPEQFDLVLNAAHFDTDHMAALVETAARSRGLIELGLFSKTAEADYQFQVRLELARHNIQPLSRATLKATPFMHPSERIFANLLDFYRIAWEYEPRSFPVQWDDQGRVTEAFTPDFYLPEFDLYVEITTMKQSLVTRKNRKVRRLRSLYPEINIQVFYQKDFQDLIFKYGLPDRSVTHV